MFDTRRQVLWGIAGLAVIVVLAVGGYFMWQKQANPYDGLVLWRETQIDDATRELLTQRIATTQAAIAAQEAVDGEADLELYLSLANDAYMLGDLVMTRESLEDVLNQNTLLPASWNTYATVLERMGDLDLAEQAYLEAIEISPAGEYYMDYALFLQEHRPERDEDVRLTLEHAVATVGQRTEFMVALAEWYLAHDECEKAIDHYKVAVTLAPTNTAIADDLEVTRATCSKVE